MNNFNSYPNNQFINIPDGRISPLSAIIQNNQPHLNSNNNHLYNNIISNHYNPQNNYNQQPIYRQENPIHNYYNYQYTPLYSDSSTALNTHYNSSQAVSSDIQTPIEYSSHISTRKLDSSIENNTQKTNEISELSDLYGIDVSSIQGDQTPTRTILLSNIPATTSARTILNHVKVGIIQQLLIIPSDSNNGTISAKLSFLILKHSIEFYCDALLKKLTIDKNKIDIQYIDEVPQGHLTKKILKLPHYKPTRNLFIAGFYNIDEEILHKKLVTDLSSFGPIDIIKIIKEKGIAFVHFLDIEDCIQAFLSVNSYSEFYENKKMGFGRDRCEFVTITERYNATISTKAINEHGLKVEKSTNDSQYFTNSDGRVMKKIPIPLSTYLNAMDNFPTNTPFLEIPEKCPYAPMKNEQHKNRNIFIGGLPLNTTLTTICNTVRGGSLEKIKLIKDKNICFVTFLESQAALAFYEYYQNNDFLINKKKCIIKWGKHSGPLDPLLKLAVYKGASRNIYIGGVKFNKNKDPFTWSNIKKTFSKFGEVEQINFLMDKGCFFVNFASIQSAVECLDKLRDDPLYKDLQMNYGKDRVGNKRRD
ncbi:uncharacterized protein HGUI_03660 [Hanseniaspora guilliermondii]|uniref:RRM domain-containing protein n=1 Tax=Hanseniaspora guilliermondii TaxID=56406 RepID=A0A1L0B8K8_9ASCO|nr:uncharacterized protein HGUI_03660 [Hanseniaspora guilliermondii]